jgi:hypothetical protein
MLIVYGMYRFRQRPTAFRNDYCLSCDDARRSIQIRSFNVIHVFWVPLLPLGVWKRWVCTVCSNNPHAATKTRRPFLWIGLAALLALTLVFWMEPAEPDEVLLFWFVRIALPLGALLLLLYLLRTPKDPSLSDKLATVEAATDTACPFCGSQLLIGTQTSCPSCSALRC